jgi:hypothetical protein
MDIISSEHGMRNSSLELLYSGFVGLLVLRRLLRELLLTMSLV